MNTTGELVHNRRVTMETLSVVAECLERHPDLFRTLAQRYFLDDCPEARVLFPTDDSTAHADLAAALIFVFNHSNADGSLTPKLVSILEQLGRDHRKFQVADNHYERFGNALNRALKIVGAHAPTYAITAAEKAITATLETMRRAAKEEDDTGLPATWTGEVIETQRRSRYISVVRLVSETPPPFAPGQYLPVTCSLMSRQWRYLSPALPPNKEGHLEFHIKTTDTDSNSRILANSRPGDIWTFGAPLGKMHISGTRDVLAIAHTTGLASIRSLLLDAATLSDPPRTHLFFGADYPGELYELLGLWNFAASAPWLSVTPVTTYTENEWWVGATEHSVAPRGLHLPQYGSLSSIVSSYGSWEDRDVLIAGPNEVVRDVVNTLLASGTPASHIQHDPF